MEFLFDMPQLHLLLRFLRPFLSRFAEFILACTGAATGRGKEGNGDKDNRYGQDAQPHW
jgi:hypothetical protein